MDKIPVVERLRARDEPQQFRDNFGLSQSFGRYTTTMHAEDNHAASLIEELAEALDIAHEYVLDAINYQTKLVDEREAYPKVHAREKARLAQMQSDYTLAVAVLQKIKEGKGT